MSIAGETENLQQRALVMHTTTLQENMYYLSPVQVLSSALFLEDVFTKSRS